jgi:hypothetical protein
MPWKKSTRGGGHVKGHTRQVKTKFGAVKFVTVKASTRRSSSNLRHK